jgi:hypothetical protein
MCFGVVKLLLCHEKYSNILWCLPIELSFLYKKIATLDLFWERQCMSKTESASKPEATYSYAKITLEAT